MLDEYVNYGFTGTQNGMTDRQRQALIKYLAEVPRFRWHHGDCIGADAESHAIVMAMSLPVILHPPTNPRKRAFCQGAMEIRLEQDYLVRNHQIVDESVRLIACPSGFEETMRSGTWATVRYARKFPRQKLITIIWPDGNVTVG